MHRLKIVSCVTLLMFCASGAFAASGPKSHRRTLNMSGTSTALIAPDANVDVTTGACNASAWVDQCSGTNCTCSEVTVSSASGNMDTGTQTVTNFFMTRDNDIDPATTNPAVVSGLVGNCNPLRAVLTDTVSSTSETKTINLLGMSCNVFNAISNANPGGNKVGRDFAGAWAIDGVSPPNPAASGWGVAAGTFTDATSAVSIKLKGPVTE